MKRCPKCSRTFPDDTQKFCTIDGGLLVSGDQPFDPNATIQGSANMAVPTAPPPEQPVSNRPPDYNETIASAPTAVLPRPTGPTNLPTSSNLSPPPAPSTPLPPPAQQAKPQPSRSAPPPSPPKAPPPPAQSAPLPPAQRAPAPPAAGAAPVAKKKSKLPLILGILAFLFILGAGGVVAAFFLVIKPRLEKRNAEPPVITRENPPENPNTNTNTNTNTNSSETKTPETNQPEFVAPPDTTQFTNSQANLDGKLAEHYFDFSFYYPNNWELDPKAGVAGAGNFAKVERRLPPDFTQENVAVRWYDSKGTYADDLPDFPRLVEQFSGDLAKSKFFPGYHQVSAGPTKINSMDAYEFKWEGLSKGTEKGDLHLWGRVVFVPTGVAGDKNGAILFMFTTSLAPELSSVEDVGTRGEMPVILDSFRFIKKP